MLNHLSMDVCSSLAYVATGSLKVQGSCENGASELKGSGVL